MALGLQPAQQQHPLLASVSADTRWLCTPSLHRHLSPAIQARLGYPCCQLGHGHPECCPHAFSYQKLPNRHNSSNNNLNASVKCLEMGDSQPEAFRAYSVILAGLGGFLPLLLTPMPTVSWGWWCQGSTTAQKLRVVVLVASGVALHACYYAPYHITKVLHVDAKMCWLAHCPSLPNKAQAEQELGPFFG